MQALECSTLRRLAIPLAVALAAVSGCASFDARKQAVDETKALQKGPEQAPFRSITGFSQGLRCMDNLMIDYGVRDVSMLVEDIVDQTKKVNAGTRDMLITAVSDMTRRSRALRVVAFGRDATNVISFLASAQRQSAYDVIPQYDIKGSVSQFDENVIRAQKGAGVAINPYLNLGVSRDAATNILGLDLSVLTTDDMGVVPGVVSRNSVAILKSGNAVDADAAYRKFGINFSMSLSRSEGQAQALRGLVELAVIELMGKLTKTPYWRCIGSEAAATEEVQLEISDWYFAMASSRVELIGYFQNQMRRRGYYDGPIDGQFNPAIDEAIANFRAAIGMSKEAVIDEALFKAYLAADLVKVPRPDKPAVFAAAPTAPSPAAASATPLALALSTPNNQTRFARGEVLGLTVRPTQDAHVYCYLQDETARIVRFYPNRFGKDSLVPAAQPLVLPGAMRFQLVMNAKGVPETIACFATPRDVLAELPQAVVGVDFEPLPVASFEQIRNAFLGASRGTFAQESLNVQPK